MNKFKPTLYAGILILILLISAHSAFAQPVWKWGRYCNTVEESWSVALDMAGNVYAGGTDNGGITSAFGSITVPGDGVTQAVWVKYSPNGTPIWAGATYGGPSQLTHITSDTSGNLIISGTIDGDSVQIGTFILHNTYFSTSGHQYYIAKINPAGTVLWAIKDGNIALPEGNGSLKTDDSGNIYMLGEFTKPAMTIGSYSLTNASSGGITCDLFLAKYTSSGALVWVRSAGGLQDDYTSAITVTPSGNLYITGYYRSPSITFGSFVLNNPSVSYYTYIVEYSPAGSILWAQSIGQLWGTVGNSLAHDTSGNIYLAGFFRDTTLIAGTDTILRAVPGPSYRDAGFLVKYSPANSVLWGRTISGIWDVGASAVTISPCGKVWLAGPAIGGKITFATGDSLTVAASGDPIYLAAYDPSGNVLSTSTLPSGGDDWNDIICNATGDVYLCGDYTNGPMTVGPDVFPYTASELFFVAKYSNVADTITDSSVIDRLCGAGSTTLTAPPGIYYHWDNGATTATRTVSSSGTYWVQVNTSVCGDTVVNDTFHVIAAPAIGPISGLASICYGWPFLYSDTTAGGSWSCSPTTIATISATSGYLLATSGGACIVTYTAPSGCTVTKAVTVLDAHCEGAVHNVYGNNQISVFPNPASTQVTIHVVYGVYFSCSVLNNLGETILSQSVTSAKTDINITSLPPGIYYVRIRGDQNVVTVRFVKE